MEKYKKQPIGKIIQNFVINDKILTNALIIKTYGIKQEGIFCCADTNRIKRIIENNLDKESFIIFDFSTLTNTNSLVYLFRYLTCFNKNVYLITSKKEKLWFVDIVS